jgi:hypothetical protein
MEPSSSALIGKSVADYYEWKPPAGGLSILLRLDVIDRMLPGIMTAFGAVPKRGAEAGGILLGTIDGPAIRIDDFEPIPCSYRRGPSYLLCDADLAAFEAAIRDRHDGPRGLKAVGFYRSHTREAQALAEDDRLLCARFFPPPHGAVLIVRPYATRPCTAGFVTYQDGALPNWPAEQFPFRRRKLDGGEPPPRVPLAETPRRIEPATPLPVPVLEKKAPRSKAWMWIPLSFLCLLLGMAAGFLGRPLLELDANTGRDPFRVLLSAKPSEDNLTIRWDREAPAIRYAEGGTLQIIDGPLTKKVELGASELQNGTIIFHTTSDRVSLRLEVMIHENSKVVSAMVWKREK